MLSSSILTLSPVSDSVLSNSIRDEILNSSKLSKQNKNITNGYFIIKNVGVKSINSWTYLFSDFWIYSTNLTESQFELM